MSVATAEPLTIEELSLAFGGNQVLKDIALEVRPGEITGLIVMLSAGCGPSEPSTQQRDGGASVTREACDVPSMSCYNGCFKRDASLICTGCCRDQRRLCDRAEEHSFSSCESIK